MELKGWLKDETAQAGKNTLIAVAGTMSEITISRPHHINPPKAIPVPMLQLNPILTTCFAHLAEPKPMK